MISRVVYSPRVSSASKGENSAPAIAVVGGMKKKITRRGNWRSQKLECLARKGGVTILLAGGIQCKKKRNGKRYVNWSSQRKVGEGGVTRNITSLDVSQWANGLLWARPTTEGAQGKKNGAIEFAGKRTEGKKKKKFKVGPEGVRRAGAFIVLYLPPRIWARRYQRR